MTLEEKKRTNTKNATEEEKEKAVQKRTKDLATWQNLAGLKMLNADFGPWNWPWQLNNQFFNTNFLEIAK